MKAADGNVKAPPIRLQSADIRDTCGDVGCAQVTTGQQQSRTISIFSNLPQTTQDLLLSEDVKQRN